MNGQNSEDRFYNWDTVRRAEKDASSPVEYPHPLADKLPVEEEALVPETPEEAFIPETPMDGTAAAVGPMGETLVHEAPTTEMMPYKAPMGEAITRGAPTGTSAGSSSAALLNREESERFRTRWNEIQGTFVDEPRAAVQQADALVSEVVEQITRMFADEHSTLESQWKLGVDVSTEDLRKALQRYRSFFNRLVV